MANAAAANASARMRYSESAAAVKIIRLIQITLRNAIGTWSVVAALTTAYLLIYFVALGPIYFVWPEPSEPLRVSFTAPPTPVNEPTPPPLLSGNELPSDIYLSRVEALLPSLPEGYPVEQTEAIDWQEVDREQALARAWCVDLVSVREGISRDVAAQLLGRAERNGELTAGWIFLDALENVGENASAFEQRRRQQCAGLLYLHHVPLDHGG